MPSYANDIYVWIDLLRARLHSGALAGCGTVTLDQFNTVDDIEQVVRTMLADLDHHASLPLDQQRQPATIQRRLDLMADFARLREQLG